MKIEDYGQWVIMGPKIMGPRVPRWRVRRNHKLAEKFALENIKLSNILDNIKKVEIFYWQIEYWENGICISDANKVPDKLVKLLEQAYKLCEEK